MDEKKKTVAPERSVGADQERSLHKTTNEIINDTEPAGNGKNTVPGEAAPGAGLPSAGNSAEEDEADRRKWEREEARRQELMMLRMMDPRFLNTVTMDELYDRVFQAKPPVIENLLYPGTYLFVGAPKLGKSFLMMQLAYHVAKGEPIWGYPVRKGTVLYLALEDDQRRLQDRLYRMFGMESAENLYLATSADTLKGSLLDQLQNFRMEHPDTGLIIIDTLQKIREMGEEKYSYANDYEVITRLKQFTDNTGICLLLVHHTRKQQAEDRFEMISGTNGLLGAADGAFLLHKDKRTSCEAVLDVSGRDQPDQTLYLNRDAQRLVWELEKAEVETFAPEPEPILDAVAEFITEENPEWKGPATALKNDLRIDIPPNRLTKKLNIHASRLRNEYGIYYESSRDHSGRQIHLKRMAPEEA